MGRAAMLLTIPLDNNGQFKLRVYADGFAPTIQTFDEFSPANEVRMAHAAECQLQTKKLDISTTSGRRFCLHKPR